MRKIDEGRAALCERVGRLGVAVDCANASDTHPTDVAKVGVLLHLRHPHTSLRPC